MTWNPIFHPALLVLIALALLAVTIAGLLRARTSGGRLSWMARIGVAALLPLACLRPGIGSAQAPVVETEADVVFLVDTTASMVAEDWDGAPRMDGAREDIMALSQLHPGARFSLITFAQEAQQRLPFTNDASALQAAVTTMRPEITRHSSGSSVTAANELLASTLESAREAGPHRLRVVYYLGDGEQTSQDPPGSFSLAAPDVSGGLVLGYGTQQGGPMRETLGGVATAPPAYIQDPAGGNAISRIDEGNLQQIAADLGIEYQHRLPGEALREVPLESAPAPRSESDVERSFDLYWILSILIFLLLLREAWVLARGIIELRNAGGRSA